MSCACRSIPWRIFFQSLAQVHRAQGTPARGLARVPPTALLRSQVLIATRKQQQQHGFHASPISRRGPAVAAAAHTLVAEKQPRRPGAAPRAENHKPTTSPPAPPRTGLPQQTASRETRGERKGTVKFIGKKRSSADAKTAPSPREPGRKTKVAPSGPAKDGEGEGARPPLEGWKAQKLALRKKFPEGWRPRKRLSPDALAGIRALNAQFPDVYTTEALADRFATSAEAIRRILRSKWQPSADEEQIRQERWFRRGMQVWQQKAALGIKPPRRWRREGIARDPSHHERARRAALRDKEIEQREIEKYKAARPWIRFPPPKGQADG